MRLPVLTLGSCGSTQPSSHARSMISTSTCLIVDRVGVDPQHARRLARRRAQPAGELRKVVGRMQAIDRVAPVFAVDQVVPVGNQVAERTTVVAERNAAVHATTCLGLHLVEREVVVDLFPVAQPHRHIAARRHLPLPFQKPCDLTHLMPSSTSASLSSRSAFRLLVPHPLAASITRSSVCCSSRPSTSACFITPSTRA